jgi:hypothetical protein
MAQHRIRCRFLLWPQLTLKPYVQRLAGVAFVANRRANTKIGEGFANIVEASARQPDVMRVVLCARDNARLVVRRKPHRLRIVELGILKRSQPEQPISKARMQSFLRDVDLIPKD